MLLNRRLPLFLYYYILYLLYLQQQQVDEEPEASMESPPVLVRRRGKMQLFPSPATVDEEPNVMPRGDFATWRKALKKIKKVSN